MTVAMKMQTVTTMTGATPVLASKATQELQTSAQVYVKAVSE